MKHFVLFVIPSAFIVSACSSQEAFKVTDGQYVIDEANIGIIEWIVVRDRPPMGHGAGKTLKRAFIPFIYTRSDGVLTFVRYCTPKKLSDPISAVEQADLRSISSIEKSCGVTGVQETSYDAAGRPMGRDNLSDTMSLSANVVSPTTGEITQPSIRFDKPSKPFWW